MKQNERKNGIKIILYQTGDFFRNKGSGRVEFEDWDGGEENA